MFDTFSSTPTLLFQAEGLKARAVTTSEFETVDCSLMLRSIGYKSLPIDLGIPFDQKAGIVPNVGGRVVDREGHVVKGSGVL